MLNDFRKSIQSVLYERVRSPFSGAFFFSWFAWNWKLLFFLFFSADPIASRIESVEANYINLNNNLIYPFLTTIFLITLFPFITTGAYWIWLKFKNWQISIRNEIERTQLLSLEKSIELRMQIRNQENEFDKFIKRKDEDISVLKAQLEEYTIPENQEYVTTEKPKKDAYLNEFLKFQQSKFYESFNVLIHTIMSRNTLSEPVIDSTVTAYYESNDIIKRDKGLIYLFTEKGLKFVKYYLDKVR